jgi:tetratricopeptide (TPR) repeat protein
VLAFLDANLTGDAKARRFIGKAPDPADVPKGLVEYEFRAGLKAPTEEEFCTVVAKQGFDRALTLYRQYKKQYPEQTLIREKVLNRIGYEFIWAGDPERSIDIFRLNVEAYPESAEAYDSLAEAYLVNGKKALAVRCYRKSLELNPKNTNAIEKLRKLEGPKFTPPRPDPGSARIGR